MLMNLSDEEIQNAFINQYATNRLANLTLGLRELSSALRDSWVLQPVFSDKGLWDDLEKVTSVCHPGPVAIRN